MKRTFAILLVLLIGLAGSALAGRLATITLDGNFADWQAGDQIDVAPNNVETNSEATDPDIVDIWVANDDNYLYVTILLNNGIDIDGTTRHVDVLVDADANASTGLNYVTWAAGCEKMAELWSSGGLGGGFYTYSGTGSDWSWTWDAGATQGTDFQWGTVSATNDRMEIRLDRTWLGDTAAYNQSRIVIDVQNTWAPVDYAPNDLWGSTYTYTYAESAPPSGIVIDGDFSEWQGSDQVDIAGLAESSGDAVDPDMVDVFMRVDNLYVNLSILMNSSFDAGSDTRHVNIMLDTDANTGTGYIGSGGANATGADYLVQFYYSGGFGTNGGYSYSGAGTDWSWTNAFTVAMGTDIAWGTDSVANDRVEVRISRSDLGIGDLESGHTPRIILGTDFNWSTVDNAPDDITTNYFELTVTDVENWSIY